MKAKDNPMEQVGIEDHAAPVLGRYDGPFLWLNDHFNSTTILTRADVLMQDLMLDIL